MELLTLKEIAGLLKISVSHARQNVVTHPRFPIPVHIPGRGKRPTPRWQREDIEEYLVQLRGQR